MTELIFYNGLFCHLGDNEIITVNSEKIITNIEAYLKEIYLELKLDEFETEEKLFSLKKLFEPFFTRKKTGQGIGLTLIREILTNHDCEFSLKTPNDGITEFRIVFSKLKS